MMIELPTRDHQYDPPTDSWITAVPLPYPYHLPVWVWKRLIGWRDKYGRKAELYFPLLKRYS